MEQCEGWDSLALLSKWALSPLFPQIIPRGCMPGAEGSVGRSRICTSCPSWSVMAGSLPWAAPTPSPSESVTVMQTGSPRPATPRPTSSLLASAPEHWSRFWPVSWPYWVGTICDAFSVRAVTTASGQNFSYILRIHADILTHGVWLTQEWPSATHPSDMFKTEIVNFYFVNISEDKWLLFKFFF